MEPATMMMLGSLAVSGAGLGAQMAGGGSSGGYSKGDLEWLAAERSRQIDAFSTQLAAARAKYMTQLNNFYGYSYGRYMPQAEAQYANRGLQVSGGAFASALAKKAADYQNQGMLTEVGMERDDLTTVEHLRGQNAAAQMGAGSQIQAQPNTLANTLGFFGGQLGNMAMASSMRNKALGVPQTQNYGPTGAENPYAASLRERGVYSQPTGQWW